MTTRNILILSIVFAEILFLGFSSTYELPALDAEEMKIAVEASVVQRKQELDLSKQLQLEREQRLDSLRREKVNMECYPSDGTITITATHNARCLCVCSCYKCNPLTGESKRIQDRFLNFSKESYIPFSNEN